MPEVEPQFIVTLRDRPYVLYAGLLDLATRSGLHSLTVRLLQVPDANNGQLAIAEATAVFADGRTFIEIGDAGPASLSPQMVPSSCRMAATRSKARVLRDALNVGVCSFEELPPQEERRSPAAPAPAGSRDCEECGQELTGGQALLSLRRYARTLCPAHQKTATVTQ